MKYLGRTRREGREGKPDHSSLARREEEKWDGVPPVMDLATFVRGWSVCSSRFPVKIYPGPAVLLGGMTSALQSVNCAWHRVSAARFGRVVAALVALVIRSGFLILSLIGTFGFGTASLGKGLFGTLTWLSLAVALSAGLFFTSDCLSEEKREGTIGFLFLTDLRGYDVVLGKLLATSLRGLYALLAVFPILAVTLLMGGVTGAHFWKTALALINALFFSLPQVCSCRRSAAIRRRRSLRRWCC